MRFPRLHHDFDPLTYRCGQCGVTIAEVRAAGVEALECPGATRAPELELAFDTEPIIGWRAWRIQPYERRGGITEHHLHALNQNGGHWRPGQRMEAQCRHGAHDAPWPSCQCGLWAVRHRESLEKSPPHAGCCGGKVALWGRVLEFEKGYRAQYAYPQELIFYGDDGLVAKEIGELYGVPVKTVAGPRGQSAQAAHTLASPGDAKAWARALIDFQRGMNVTMKALSVALDDAAATINRKPPRPKPSLRDAIRFSRRSAR